MKILSKDRLLCSFKFLIKKNLNLLEISELKNLNSLTNSRFSNLYDSSFKKKLSPTINFY